MQKRTEAAPPALRKDAVRAAPPAADSGQPEPCAILSATDERPGRHAFPGRTVPAGHDVPALRGKSLASLFSLR